MSLKKFLIFCLLLCISVTSFSQFEVNIKGSFPGASGKKIRLFEFSDQISLRHKFIDSSIIDKNNEFSFSFTSFNPKYIFFRIDHSSTGFYIEPGKNYVINFDSVDFKNIDIRRNPYLEPIDLLLKISSSESPILNELIDSLEYMLQGFLNENLSANRRRQLAPLVIKFKEKTDSVFLGIDNLYFKNYYKYLLGRYMRIANAKPDYLLGLEYFYDMEVLYDNTAYMDFFNSYFDSFIFTGSKGIKIQDIEFTINELGSYTALMDSLGKDSLLRNEVLRELVLLKSMDKLYYNRDFNRNNIEKILNQVINHSKFNRHKEIAENIIYSRTYLRPGSQAPDLFLMDGKENVFELKDLNGKFLYLSFYTSWCVPCMEEFPIKEILYQKYGDFIHFVSVSVDRYKTQYEQFNRNNKYSWQFYHFKDNFELLDDYHVRAFPLFVLISPDGKIVSHTAQYPSQMIQGYFDYLKFQYFNTDREQRRKIFEDINR